MLLILMYNLLKWIRESRDLCVLNLWGGYGGKRRDFCRGTVLSSEDSDSAAMAYEELPLRNSV